MRTQPDHGHLYMVHVVAGIIGLGGLVFSVTVVHLPATHRADIVPWWAATAFVLVGGLAALAVLGLLTRVPAAAVQRVAAGWALLVLAVVAALPILHVGRPVLETQWLQGFLGPAVAAAALAWRPRTSAAYLVALGVLWGVARWWDTGRDRPLLALQDAAYATTAGLILVSVIWLVLRAARTVDTTAATEAEHRVTEARTESRAAERARLAAVVHDGVLAALLAASSGTASRDAVALEARRALDDLDELRQPTTTSGEVEAGDLVLRLRVRATVVGQGAQVVTDLEPARVPETVAVKLVAAAVEALRNSVRHAGPAATRTVTVTVRPGRAEVSVRDDGVGFDPDAVPAARLGLRGSVVGRMSRVPGGWAEVRSQPGAGTEVVVGWRA